MGFPILVKAVMGGGGKGMKLAMKASELRVRSHCTNYVMAPIVQTALQHQMLQSILVNLLPSTSGPYTLCSTKVESPIMPFLTCTP